MIMKTNNALESLRTTGTVVIADTADFQKIKKFNPSEGTTNPSLLYKAAQQPAYASLLQKSVEYAQSLNLTAEQEAERLEFAVEHLAVQFGTEIYKLTGRVSTEVDVRHSFHTDLTVAAALRIIDLYAAQGVPKEAVRIKISATWEGIQAARILEQKHGISVLITVVFSLVQAIAAGEAEVSCIAPYVGRIGDWHKANGYQGKEDMGVKIVRDIQNYLRKYEHKTQVMGASFRSTTQVKDLAGLDYLTVAPEILEKLEEENEELVPCLSAETAQASPLEKKTYINDQGAYLWAFNSDACAVEKSAEAMRKFAEDTEKLKELVAEQLKK